MPTPSPRSARCGRPLPRKRWEPPARRARASTICSRDRIGTGSSAARRAHAATSPASLRRSICSQSVVILTAPRAPELPLRPCATCCAAFASPLVTAATMRSIRSGVSRRYVVMTSARSPGTSLSSSRSLARTCVSMAGGVSTSADGPGDSMTGAAGGAAISMSFLNQRPRTAAKSSMENGLDMKSSMPAARHRSRSPFMAWAVTATIVVWRALPSRWRISAVAANPSISGI